MGFLLIACAAFMAGYVFGQWVAESRQNRRIVYEVYDVSGTAGRRRRTDVGSNPEPGHPP